MSFHVTKIYHSLCNYNYNCSLKQKSKVQLLIMQFLKYIICHASYRRKKNLKWCLMHSSVTTKWTQVSELSGGGISNWTSYQHDFSFLLSAFTKMTTSIFDFATNRSRFWQVEFFLISNDFGLKFYVGLKNIKIVS